MTVLEAYNYYRDRHGLPEWDELSESAKANWFAAIWLGAHFR